MAKTVNTTIKFTGQFDTSQITKGLQDIKKQVTNANISEDLKKQFETAFNKLQVNIPALEKLTSKEDFNLKDIQAFQKLLKEVTKDWENLNKVTDQIDLSKTFSAKDLEKINNLDKQIKQTQDNIQKARKELVDAFTSETKMSISSKNVSDALTELFTVNPAEIDSKFQEIQQQFSEGVQQTQVELENKLKDANIQKTGKSLIDYFFGEDSGVEFAGKVGPIKDQINDIIRTYRDAQQKGDIAGVAEQVKKLNEVLTNTANFKFPEGYKLFGLPTQEDLNTLNQIGGVLNKVRELAEGKEVFFTEEEARLAEQMAQKIEAEAQAARNANEDNNNLKKTIKETGDNFKNAGKKADDLSDKLNRQKAQADALNATFGSLAHRIESAVSAMAVFNKSMQIVRQAIKSVEDLDAAFTQIAIVSEQSNESAWKMFESFNKLAKQYSITTKDLTEGAKLFYQQGLNAADTMKMVEASTVSAALGEVTMTEAANTLTAAIQGYNESAAVAMDYTDKIAMVGAVSAADFNELSVAMEKTASSAYTAGIDFDHLLGYLGKMIEVTREAPANLGTAMKTIIARFEDMKKDPMAILEDGVSANKVEAALATIGIALRNSEGEFRALQDVMDELGIKWNSLTRNQQAYIATVAAGSRQQSRFLALMNNYDRTLDLIAESQNSAGAAAQQYATYQDSIAAAQNRLTASWEKFYSKIIDNSAIKFAINSLSNLVEALSHVPPAITAIGAALGALQLQNFMRTGGKDLFTNIFGKITTDDKGVKQISDNIIQSLFKGIRESLQKQQGKTVEEFAKQFEISGNSISKVGEGISKSLGKIPGNLKEVGSGFATAGKAVAGFVVANWEIIAVAAAVAGAIYFINRALTANKRKYEENIQSIKNYQEQASELTSKVNTAESLLDTYDELSTKINRTTEEQNELNSVIESLVELYPDAIKYTDEYGNEHLENSKILREEIELEKQLAREKNRAALEQRQTLLKETDRKKWKKEDFEDIGFSNSQVSKYFDLQDQLNLYNGKYLNLYAAWGGANSLNGKVDRLSELRGHGELFNNAAITNIKDINKLIEKCGLRVSKLDEDIIKLGEDKAFDIIKRKIEEIFNIRDNLPNLVKNAEEAQDKIVANLQKDNEIQLSFLDLVYSEKKETSTTQRIIASKLQAFFSSIGSEAYQAFKDSLGDTTLTEYIQAAIDNITDADEAIKVKNLIEEALDPSTSQTRLLEIYAELGIKAGKDFADGFQIGIEENRKKNREDLEETVRNAYGLNKDFSFVGYSDERLKSLNELSKYTKDFDAAYELVPYYDEVYKITEEAAKNGSIQGIIDGVNNIDITDLDNVSKEIFEDFADELTEGAIWAATQDTFEKLQQEAEEFISNTKKSLDAVQSDGRVSAKDYSLEAKDYSFGVYFDPTTGEKMVSTARILLDIEEENNKKLEETRRQYQNNLELIEHIIDLGEEATDNDKKHLKELESQNQVLLNQYKYYQKISDITLESGWNTSIQLAKNYQSQLQTINNLEKAMAKQGGILFLNDMEDAMSILPEFQNRFTEVSDNTYTISAENIEAMKKEIKSEYDLWLAQEKAKAVIEYENAVTEFELIKAMAEQEGVIDDTNTEQFIENNQKELESTKKECEETLNASMQEIEQELTAHSEKDNQMVQMFDTALLAMGKHYEDFIEDIKSGNMTPIYDGLYNEIKKNPLSTTTSIDIDFNFLKDDSSDAVAKRQKLIKDALEQASKRVKAAWKKLSSLKEINVPELEKLQHSLDGAGKSAEDTEKALKAIADVINNILDALENLDKLLKDVKRDLKDISVDYNPFTDLFEAWEHEWDYYYNIKRLIAQIETQGKYIDNVISADYTSADQKVNAYHAKIGNLLAQMSANDAYIESLRTGMSQTAVELMEQYGKYYRVDPNTGQVYQNDLALNEINDTINQRKKEIYEQQKLQNQKENDLALEEAKLDALEKEKSAYEDILDEINSQIDSLSSAEDITADLSALESQKAEIEAKLKVTEDSIEEAKKTIKNLEDEIQNISVGIEIDEGNLSELEDYVEDMEDKLSEYEEYWETLNETIANQQELLQNLNDIYNTYVDTAISTQQELYDAIVENYQNEIDKKKKEYDILKALDNEYLQSVKDNITKQRQARDDANKQKAYQQNIQRAQLLQMDTSGAFRSELAQLNKEIEGQREELYDDLVDKQVEALEKEIEKRHELYDKEVAALEERLAYMQENAVLLWESVNEIVAKGADAMMATLEKTTSYINSNELSKQKQRDTWEQNVKLTFDGVKKNVIDMLGNLIDAGNNYITDELPEVETSLDNYSAVFNEATEAMSSYNTKLKENTESLFGESGTFKTILNSFMTSWTTATSKFTGYSQDWSKIVKDLKDATSKNIEALKNMNNDGGSIKQLDQSLRDSAEKIYNDFLEERRKYRDELSSLIKKIEIEISAAITNAANAIRNAANSIQATPSNNNDNGNGSNGNNGNSNNGNGDNDIQNTSPSEPNQPVRNRTPKGYAYDYQVQTKNGKVHSASESFTTKEEAEKAYKKAKNRFASYLTMGGKVLMDRSPYPFYKKGGLADFTGPAWLDGTKSNPERILSPRQTKLFESMVSSLERTANNSNINSTLGSSYNIGDINTTIKVDKFDSQTDINRLAMQVEDKIVKDIRNRVSISITKGV